MSTFFNNLESYGLFLIYKMLIWTSRNIPNVGLFSAYAEVFLVYWGNGSAIPAFLCLRRGVSIQGRCCCADIPFSLPTQRCFSEGTLSRRHTEAFLCLRRGVSAVVAALVDEVNFSLPTQRCFRISRPTAPVGGLFSAYAEVFLRRGRWGFPFPPFLCLRRGVSVSTARSLLSQRFSLPTQRCFQRSRATA